MPTCGGPNLAQRRFWWLKISRMFASWPMEVLKAYGYHVWLGRRMAAKLGRWQAAHGGPIDLMLKPMMGSCRG